jgi:16S rRNA processing protein RimM
LADYFLIAKIIQAFGKNGFVKISSYSDFPQRFFNLKNVYVDFEGDKKKFFVENVTRQKNFFALKFKNFDSDKDVEVLSGKEIFVDDENLVKLPNDFFFIHDLIGSKVFKNDEQIGEITDVINLPANDVYVIRDKEQKEILIPAVLEFIESFDPQKKVMILKPGSDFYEQDED